jgi:hypothetical protein
MANTDSARRNRTLRQATRLARQLMPRDGDIDGLVGNLSAHRSRPLTMIDSDLGQDGPSGLWLATPTKDYIVVDTAGSPSRRAAVICHEVAHILLGHTGDPVAQDVASLVPNIRPSLAARFLARHGYDEPDEHAAEDLATQLVAEHTRRDRAAQLNQNTISARLR